MRLLSEGEELLQFVTDGPAHDRRYRVDPAKLLALGWEPRWRFADGLAATVCWYVQNEGWWWPITSGAYRAYYEQNYGDRSRFECQGVAA